MAGDIVNWRNVTHDPLCPEQVYGKPDQCRCALIAKVREDQDRRNAEAEGVKAYLVTEKVEALLEKAKTERDAGLELRRVNRERDKSYLYGQAMWFGGRVSGIAEALEEMRL